MILSACFRISMPQRTKEYTKKALHLGVFPIQRPASCLSSEIRIISIGYNVTVSICLAHLPVRRTLCCLLNYICHNLIQHYRILGRNNWFTSMSLNLFTGMSGYRTSSLCNTSILIKIGNVLYSRVDIPDQACVISSVRIANSFPFFTPRSFHSSVSSFRT